jgi:glucose-1-phosphate cytidylyltransferase
MNGLDKKTPVIILCGGKGIRIADISENIPKPMVPIGGKPILWHIMKIYAEYGYKNFILALGHKSWQIKNYFLNYRLQTLDFQIDFKGDEKHVTFLNEDQSLDWTIKFAETGEDTQTGKRIAQCEKYVKTNHFMVTYGDGVANININALMEHHLSNKKTGTVTSVRPTSRFGNIELNSQNLVTAFNEKENAGGGTINGGFMVFKKEFFQVAEKYGDVMLEREPMMHLVQEGELTAYNHTGFWEPMDTSREYHLLNSLWEKDEAKWKIWK